MIKHENEYVPFSLSLDFTIWTNDGHCIRGHMQIKTSDSKEVISQKLIGLVTKLCKDNNLSEEQTIKHIKDNLENNGLKDFK